MKTLITCLAIIAISLLIGQKQSQLLSHLEMEHSPSGVNLRPTHTSPLENAEKTSLSKKPSRKLSKLMTRKTSGEAASSRRSPKQNLKFMNSSPPWISKSSEKSSPYW